MSITIMDALKNAKYNLTEDVWIFLCDPVLNIAISQVKNAVTLLEKNYNLDDCIDDIFKEYGEIDNVPKKQYDFKEFDKEWEKKMRSFTKNELIRWIKNNFNTIKSV